MSIPRGVGAVCLAAVVAGLTVWIADLLGVLSVRQAFITMLLGFTTAHVVALVHLACVSRLPKAQKWEWVWAFSTWFLLFASIDYLFSEGGERPGYGNRRSRPIEGSPVTWTFPAESRGFVVASPLPATSCGVAACR